MSDKIHSYIVCKNSRGHGGDYWEAFDTLHEAKDHVRQKNESSFRYNHPAPTYLIFEVGAQWVSQAKVVTDWGLGTQRLGEADAKV